MSTTDKPPWPDKLSIVPRPVEDVFWLASWIRTHLKSEEDPYYNFDRSSVDTDHS